MQSLAQLVVLMLLTVTLIGPACVALSLLTKVSIIFVWLVALLAAGAGVAILSINAPIRWLGAVPIICAIVGLYLRLK